MVTVPTEDASNAELGLMASLSVEDANAGDAAGEAEQEEVISKSDFPNEVFLIPVPSGFDLLDIFKEYDDTWIAWAGDTLRGMVDGDRAIIRHLTPPERHSCGTYEAAREDSAAKMFWELLSNGSPQMCEAVIEHMVRRPKLYRLLNTDYPPVKARIEAYALEPVEDLCSDDDNDDEDGDEEEQEPDDDDADEDNENDSDAASSKGTSAGPQEEQWAFIADHRFQDSTLTGPGAEAYQMQWTKINDKTPLLTDVKYPVIVKDEPLEYGRLVLVQTHVLYPSATRCMLRFNLLLQTNRTQFKAANIHFSMKALPNGNVPKITGIFPDSPRAWEYPETTHPFRTASSELVHLTFGHESCGIAELKETMRKQVKYRVKSTWAGDKDRVKLSLPQNALERDVPYCFNFGLEIDLPIARCDLTTMMRIEVECEPPPFWSTRVGVRHLVVPLFYEHGVEIGV